MTLSFSFFPELVVDLLRLVERSCRTTRCSRTSDPIGRPLSALVHLSVRSDTVPASLPSRAIRWSGLDLNRVCHIGD